MEISDEVVALAIAAAEKKYTCVQISLPAMKEAIQAALPLVVEGLVGPMDDESIAADKHQYTALHAKNELRQDILAKVKK